MRLRFHYRLSLLLILCNLGLDPCFGVEKNPIVFPQFVNGTIAGLPNRTRIVLRNRGPENIAGRVVFRSSDGSPAAVPIENELGDSYLVQIPGRGTLEMSTSGTGPLVAGTVQVVTESARADDLSGTLVYEVLGNFVSVENAPILRLLRLYASVNRRENTGIALFNPSGENVVTVKLTLFDQTGGEMAEVTRVLQPFEQVSAFLDEEALFQEQLGEEFRGTVLVEAVQGGAVSAISLLQQRQSGALIAVSPEGQGFFDLRGEVVVDPSGRFTNLRGVNLGGWLVPEGYILQMPGFGSPTSIRRAIEELIGLEKADLFYTAYLENYVRQDDLVQLARWGFNTVRIPLHYEWFYDRSEGEFTEVGFEILDRLISWAKPCRLYLILDMHCAPGGQNAGNISDSDGLVARFWTEGENQDLTVRIWEEIARRYNGERQILGYDLLNEPVLPPGYSNSVLRTFYERLASAIRQSDQNHLLFVEGNWWATDFNLLTPPFDSKLVYSFHKYWSPTSADSIAPFLDLRRRFGTPLWVGEFGENSNDWATEVIEVLEANGIGWAWWTHKKVETISSPYSSPLPESYQKVLDYWNGYAPRPSVEDAEKGLFDLANSLLFDQSRIQPDVVQALLDPLNGRRLRSFQPLVVPGSFAAVHYGLGKNGVAYFDQRAKRSTYEDSTPWNMGWRYRNDGVDIEESSDPEGNGYNVGWTEAGEWLDYPIEVSEAGVYSVDLRVASAVGGGRIRFFLNGTRIGTDLQIGNTGGWQRWVSRTLTGIALPSGNHVLRVSFISGGLNLSRITFRLEA